MSLSSKVRGLAELGRVSNLPTTVTNVLVGTALASMGGPLEPWRIGAAAIAIALLYVGGMAMNDAMDAKIDATERPSRPIPSGKVTLGEAVALITCCLGIGLGLLWATGTFALASGAALVGAIVLYNTSHKGFPQMVFIMGVCRGLVYLTAAKAVQPSLALTTIIWPAVGLTLYVAILTYVARSENGPKVGGRRWLAFAMPLVVLPATLHLGTPEVIVPAVCFGALMVLIQLRAVYFLFSEPVRTVNAIMTWIAGISMIDAYFAALLGELMLAGMAVACAMLTIWGHRRISGT